VPEALDLTRAVEISILLLWLTSTICSGCEDAPIGHERSALVDRERTVPSIQLRDHANQPLAIAMLTVADVPATVRWVEP